MLTYFWICSGRVWLTDLIHLTDKTTKNRTKKGPAFILNAQHLFVKDDHWLHLCFASICRETSWRENGIFLLNNKFWLCSDSWWEADGAQLHRSTYKQTIRSCHDLSQLHSWSYDLHKQNGLKELRQSGDLAVPLKTQHVRVRTDISCENTAVHEISS